MNKYVLTFIGHNGCLPKLDEYLLTFLARNSDVKFTESKQLGSYVIDQYFLSNEDELNQNNVVDLVGADVILQHDDEYRRKKLCVFDMDSTLIYQEVIELIAAYAGVESEVREITNRAMNNEIDFKASLKERVGLLKGLEIEQLYDEIKPKLLLTNGVSELSKILKNDGVKLAVLSGGFVPFAEYIKSILKFDYFKANVLETDADGKLTGEILGEIVDGENKATSILELCSDFDIALENSVMIGDGGNDLAAMSVAGFGIAWNAKPNVQELAPSKLNTNSLLDVLYILGYTESEIESKSKENV